VNQIAQNITEVLGYTETKKPAELRGRRAIVIHFVSGSSPVTHPSKEAVVRPVRRICLQFVPTTASFVPAGAPTERHQMLRRTSKIKFLSLNGTTELVIEPKRHRVRVRALNGSTWTYFDPETLIVAARKILDLRDQGKLRLDVDVYYRLLEAHGMITQVQSDAAPQAESESLKAARS
jgi:hypothetical protein